MKYLSGIVACLLLFLLVAPAPGDSAPYVQLFEGYTTPAGFVYRNGYWWQNGLSYTRYWVPGTDGYYGRSGCYSCYTAGTPGYWQYSQYTAPAASVTKIAYTADWKTHALDALAKRDDLNAFQNTIAALNSTAIQSSYSSGYGSYGVSGQTVYARGGYNALTAQLYNTTDVNLSNMLAARLTQNAQTLAGQAHSEHTALVSQINAGAAQVAVINALASGSQPPAASVSNTFQLTPLPASPTAPQAPVQAQLTPLMPHAADVVGDALVLVWNDPGPDGCVKCHGGASPAKGLTLDAYRRLSRQQKIDRVWKAHLAPEVTDTKAIMPRDGTGVGHHLPDEKLKAFFDDIMATK